MQDQKKFNLTIIARQADDIVINQIRSSDGPVWPALVAQILTQGKEKVWWLEVERLDNGYRLTVMTPTSGKYPKHESIIYLSEEGQVRLRTEDLADLLETR